MNSAGPICSFGRIIIRNTLMPCCCIRMCCLMFPPSFSSRWSLIHVLAVRPQCKVCPQEGTPWPTVAQIGHSEVQIREVVISVVLA